MDALVAGIYLDLSINLETEFALFFYKIFVQIFMILDNHCLEVPVKNIKFMIAGKTFSVMQAS